MSDPEVPLGGAGMWRQLVLQSIIPLHQIWSMQVVNNSSLFKETNLHLEKYWTVEMMK